MPQLERELKRALDAENYLRAHQIKEAIKKLKEAASPKVVRRRLSQNQKSLYVITALAAALGIVIEWNNHCASAVREREEGYRFDRPELPQVCVYWPGGYEPVVKVSNGGGKGGGGVGGTKSVRKQSNPTAPPARAFSKDDFAKELAQSAEDAESLVRRREQIRQADALADSAAADLEVARAALAVLETGAAVGAKDGVATKDGAATKAAASARVHRAEEAYITALDEATKLWVAKPGGALRGGGDAAVSELVDQVRRAKAALRDAAIAREPERVLRDRRAKAHLAEEVRACVGVVACVRVYVRACVRVYVRVCVCVCVRA